MIEYEQTKEIYMIVKISINQEFDLNDDNIFDETNTLDTSDKVDLLVSRFIEDIDNMVKLNETRDWVEVDYLED